MPKKAAPRKSIEIKHILRLLRHKAYSPRKLLQEMLLPKNRRLELSNLLRALAEEGKIVRLRGGMYGTAARVKKVRGRLVQHQPGFAFVIPQEEGEADLYIPGFAIQDAMPDDEVEVQIIPESGRHSARPGRRQAQIVRILKRAHETIVGNFIQERNRSLIQPDGMIGLHIFIVPKGGTLTAKHGDKVVASVSAWPSRDYPGQARVKEVLGPLNDPGVDITAIIRRRGIPEAYSQASIAQAEKVAQEPGPQDLAGRLDLREQVIVTIDGADARDFDDGVSCEALDQGGWRLGVHIADVSHYVKTGTRLDLEARERGTSVYLPDRVLHMLPEALSCGVCSLVPHKDRFAVTAFMEITPEGKIGKTEFYRSVIHSHARLTYDWVEEVLAGKNPDNPAAPYGPLLLLLSRVSGALRQAREARGSLDFDLPDPKVVLGPDGKVVTIEKRMQLSSHRLIEDCMIAANEAVAGFLQRKDIPSLYRVHEPPAGDKLEEFKETLQFFGYTLDLGKPKEASLAFQNLTKKWKNTPEEEFLNMALLRTMKLAVYASRNTGHFGLGSPCYTHFTSPIRRYPDLVVHRMLTETIEKKAMDGTRSNTLKERMAKWGQELSDLERRAERAEREAVKIKQIEFMTGKIGGIFTGRIASVANFGFFVELDEHFVEGLVRVSDLRDDYYYFDEQLHILQGTNSGRLFRVGQKVKIKVERIDWVEQRVIFSLEDNGLSRKKDVKQNNPRIVKRGKRKRW